MEDFLKFKIDVCSRIPYNVICKVEFDNSDYDEFKGTFVGGILTTTAELLGYNNDDEHVDINVLESTPKGDYISEQACMGLITINDITPYLRPMSSMTKEEKEQMEALGLGYYDEGIYENEDGEKIIYGEKTFQIIPGIQSYDWLISHYFDVHDLIPLGLALAAPVDMYTEKIKENETRKK